MSGFLNSLRSLAVGGSVARHGSAPPSSSNVRNLRFSADPIPGDSGFSQWRDAMRMVARLPGGIPPEFRKRLWLTLSDRYLHSRGVDWIRVERLCFNEWSNPDDDQLGEQIVKDLHRTGCSLFCGADAEPNQALLKRVLLGYARWNKAVGYCQGFNMLAALILQVMDKNESDSLKVMIFLIEGVLPESYFANSLRGLSVDMAVFRDLLRIKLPALSRHLEQLQLDASIDQSVSYEPPLTNVFTMQWFLTLFCNCLPHDAVLRVWDLVFLEGNEVLLRTALAIWDGLADRIMTVESADEFYSIMGVLTREMLEFGLMDANHLVKTVVTSLGPFPMPQVAELRDRYTYNITPWTQLQSAGALAAGAKRGLTRLLFDNSDEEEEMEDERTIALATAYGMHTNFKASPKRRDSLRGQQQQQPQIPGLSKDRLNLDIAALKQQYSKLRERQKQAHVILTAACARQKNAMNAPNARRHSAVNHLLLGRKALIPINKSNNTDHRHHLGHHKGRVAPLPLKPTPCNVSGEPRRDMAAMRNRRATISEPIRMVIPKVMATRTKPPPSSSSSASSGSGSSGNSVSRVSLPRSNVETIHWTAEKERRKSLTAPPLSTALLVQQIDEKTEKPDDDEDKSSTSTELCDDDDQLSDLDSGDELDGKNTDTANKPPEADSATQEEAKEKTKTNVLQSVTEEEAATTDELIDVTSNQNFKEETLTIIDIEKADISPVTEMSKNEEFPPEDSTKDEVDLLTFPVDENDSTEEMKQDSVIPAIEDKIPGEFLDVCRSITNNQENVITDNNFNEETETTTEYTDIGMNENDIDILVSITTDDDLDSPIKAKSSHPVYATKTEEIEWELKCDISPTFGPCFLPYSKSDSNLLSVQSSPSDESMSQLTPDSPVSPECRFYQRLTSDICHREFTLLDAHSLDGLKDSTSDSDLRSVASSLSNDPREAFREHGRRNSERALQIIQENSKILERILGTEKTTKQGFYWSESSESSGDSGAASPCDEVHKRPSLLTTTLGSSTSSSTLKDKSSSSEDSPVTSVRAIETPPSEKTKLSPGFCPFPTSKRQSNKEIGLKLGLYSPTSEAN